MKVNSNNKRKVMHAELASGRWSTFTLAEQLRNVASEVGRTFKNLRNQNLQHITPAFDRAIELLDLTITDTRWGVFRKQELLRAREEFCKAVFSPSINDENLNQLEKYFMDFALLARRSR